LKIFLFSRDFSDFLEEFPSKPTLLSPLETPSYAVLLISNSPEKIGERIQIVAVFSLAYVIARISAVDDPNFHAALAS